MKQSLLIVLAFYTQFSQAQQAHQLLEVDHTQEISLCVAPVFSAWDTKSYDGNMICGEPRLGFGATLLYTSVFNRYFSIQTGLIYNKLPYEIALEKNHRFTLELENLHLPLLFTLNTDKLSFLNYTLFAGPQIGWNISSSMQYPEAYENNNLRDTLHTVLSVSQFDLGIA